MNTQKLTLYETWDDLEATPMPHSRLYSLEPLGVGTAQVESLTSYLARLAFAHQVSVSCLLLGEIAPAFRRPKTKSAFFGTLNYGLLRANDLNKELIWILQRLTGRLELPYLSILPWAEIMATSETVRHHRAWCSGCLEEQRSAGEVVYEPLWWSFQSIAICPRHNQALQTRCPHCLKEQHPWLAPRSNAGYCSACQTWLGIVPDPQDLKLPAMTDFELSWQHWLVEAIGELLAAGPDLRHIPLQERLVAGLSNSCAQVAEGNVRNFAKILATHNLNISTSRLKNWLRGEKRPPLRTLLQLCFCLRIKPLALLTTRTALKESASLRTLAFPAEIKPKRVKPALIKDQLEKSIKAIVAADEDPPPSLSQVSRQLNVAGTTSLLRYFPEQCAIIVERYRAYRQTQKQERLRLIRENVRQATFDVYAQGLYPSLARVTKQLGKSVSMRDPDARAFWKETIRELDL